jgi:hypothetical protein
MEPTEDVPYSTPDFATPEDEKKTDDVDQPNKSVIKEVLEEIENDIGHEGSFTSLNTPANATVEEKIAAYDEIAIHKGVALYLEKYKIMLENKLKELK